MTPTNESNLDDVHLRIRWCGVTDRGRVKVQNEDSFLGVKLAGRDIALLGRTGEESIQSGDFIFAVSDGMGGAKAGGFASQVAIQKITTLLPNVFKQSAAGLKVGFADIFVELFDQIHKSLSMLERSYEECAGMGTTLSLCWFKDSWMYFGHVGDSRIYYLSNRSGLLKQLSEDDTHVGWLYRHGKISEREARDHPRRHILQNALGGGHQFMQPQVGAVAFEKGDVFLLCTDGLIDGLSEDQILRNIREPQEGLPKTNPSQRLVEKALEQSGKDNTTAIVIEII